MFIMYKLSNRFVLKYPDCPKMLSNNFNVIMKTGSPFVLIMIWLKNGKEEEIPLNVLQFSKCT